MRLLKGAGLKVSVDSFSLDELTRGARAGADFLLSLNEETLDLAFETDAVPVLVPVRPDDLPSLDRAIERMEKAGRPYMADPILEPIHFGFVESITRYHETRRRWPGIEMMMGTGNLTCSSPRPTASGSRRCWWWMRSELSVLQRAHRPGLEPHPPHGGGARRGAPGDVRGQGGLGPAERLRPRPPGAPRQASLCPDPGRDRSPGGRDPRSELPHRGGRGRRSTCTTATTHAIGTDAMAFFPTSRLSPVAQDGGHAFYLGGELTKADPPGGSASATCRTSPCAGVWPPTPRRRHHRLQEGRAHPAFRARGRQGPPATPRRPRPMRAGPRDRDAGRNLRRRCGVGDAPVSKAPRIVCGKLVPDATRAATGKA